MAKNVIFYPQKIDFLESTIFKLQTPMITQNDRNKILRNFFLLHFFAGCLEKLENGKKRDFLPQKCPKELEIFLKSSIFQATELFDSSK